MKYRHAPLTETRYSYFKPLEQEMQALEEVISSKRNDFHHSNEPTLLPQSCLDKVNAMPSINLEW